MPVLLGWPQTVKQDGTILCEYTVSGRGMKMCSRRSHGARWELLGAELTNQAQRFLLGLVLTV